MDNERELSSNRLARKRSGVFHACNACRQRKVKCNGKSECGNCLQAGLKCVYSFRSPSARSRQSIIRGAVIASCRGDDLQNLLPETSIRDHDQSPAFPISFFWDLVDDYCKFTLPTVPIIGEEEFRSAIRSLAHSSENVPLVYSLAAQTLNLTRIRTKAVKPLVDHSRTLFELALQARGPLLNLHQITLQTVLVSVLASMGMFAATRDLGMGTYYHLEAVAGLQALRVDDEESQSLFDPRVAAQRDRLHWLIFIHNRFHSISEDQVCTLSPLSRPPQPTLDLPPDVSAWFCHIAQLFMVVDDDFLRFHKDKNSPYLTLKWIEQKQSQLDDDIGVWSEDIRQLADLHRVDLIITRYWLRTLVWQMALHKFALSSDPQNHDPDFMSLDFPIHLSHQLRYLLTTNSPETVEVHGTGILQKVFEIACTVADLLLHVVPRTCDPEAWATHLNSFLVLHSFLFRMSKFYEVERNVLAAKLEEVRSVFPTMLYELQVSP